MTPLAYLEMEKTEANHWWYVGRRAILADLIKSLNLPINSKILEVGCGTGGNLKMLSEFGEVSAFEMDSAALAIATEKTNHFFDLRSGSCPYGIPNFDHNFDLICIFDVLEHIEEDSKTLVFLRKLLAKNGRILMTVPAYQWLYGPHDVMLHHVRRYSKIDLQKKIESAELHAVKISYFNTILFPIIAFVRLKDKFLARGVSGTNVPPECLNKIFIFVFSAERFILKYLNFIFGASLTCLLEIKNEK